MKISDIKENASMIDISEAEEQRKYTEEMNRIKKLLKYIKLTYHIF